MKTHNHQAQLAHAVRQVHNGQGYDLPSKVLRQLLNRGYIEPHKDHYRATDAGKRFARIKDNNHAL